jgi:hypothetical protein
MTITKIISAGQPGAESAALDIAIRLKIPYGGYATTSSMLEPYRLHRRYKLMEKDFNSSRAMSEANVHLGDATLVFSHGALSRDLTLIDDYAFSHGHPNLHVDFDQMEPLQAAFRINVWAHKHSSERLYVTGSTEEEDGRIYQAVYDTLFRFLMMGRDAYPEQEQVAVEKKALPKTIEEAVAYLIDTLPLKDKVTIANMSADEIGALNMGLGNYIRNSFGLWSDNKALLWSCSKDAGQEINTPDEASAIIIARLALALEKTHKIRPI